MLDITAYLDITPSEVEVRNVVVWRGGLCSGRHRSEEQELYYKGIGVNCRIDGTYWWSNYGLQLPPDIIRERITKIRFANLVKIDYMTPCGLQFPSGNYEWGRVKGFLKITTVVSAKGYKDVYNAAYIVVETDKDGIEDAWDLYRYLSHNEGWNFWEKREEMREEFNKRGAHRSIPYRMGSRIVRR